MTEPTGYIIQVRPPHDKPWEARRCYGHYAMLIILGPDSIVVESYDPEFRCDICAIDEAMESQ